MSEPLLTILTPTYNRGHLLRNLYSSLLKQTNMNFEWMIVDDGSGDDTEAVVRNFLTQNPFKIIYLRKENGGKHTALNYGISRIETKLTIIVDSDDTLLPEAIKEIDIYYRKYGIKKKIATWSFLKCYSDGRPIVELEKKEFVANYIKYRIKGNRPGDMAEVFRTKVLKTYPFPEYPGEKFLSEDVVWIEIGKKYDCVYINKAIYQCEYLEGGLTANDKPMKFASPKGSMMRGKQLMSKECGFKSNVKGSIIYGCYKKICGDKLSLSTREKLLCLLTKPLATFYFRKWNPNKEY